MKNLFTAVFVLLVLNSCTKEDSKNSLETNRSSKEISQVQKPLILKNNRGEELSVTYFAEGNMVGVKLEKTGEKEQKLSAKTTSTNGNPIFTNDSYMWEITQDGKAGKLSDRDGNASEYQ